MVQQVPTLEKSHTQRAKAPPANNTEAYAVAIGAPGAAVVGMLTTLMVLLMPRDPALAIGVIATAWTLYGTVVGGLLFVAWSQE